MWAGHVARIGEMKNAYKILVGKPEGRRTFGRTKRRREDNIKTVLKNILCESVEWIRLAQDRYQWRALVNTIMNLLFT
jgi:hypothetical protein